MFFRSSKTFFSNFLGLIKIEPQVMLSAAAAAGHAGSFIKIEATEASLSGIGGGGGIDLDSTYSPAGASSPGQSPPASPGGGKMKVNPS
jgi:hypothetical protein